MRPDNKTATQRQAGQTLVEFALIAPVLMFLLFAIVDFAVLLNGAVTAQHFVENVSRQEGVAPSDPTAIASALRGKEIPFLDLEEAKVCFVDDDGDGRYGEIGDSIRVEADYLYPWTGAFAGAISWFGGSLGPKLSINVSATKRLEDRAPRASEYPANASGECP